MTAPKRIQRKRTKGWRMPEGAVYVGRPTRWGNPFRIENEPEMPEQRWMEPYGGPWVVWASDVGPRLGRFKSRRQASEAAVRWYREWLNTPRMHIEAVDLEHYDFVRSHLRDLRGKSIACWCSVDDPCHGDVLLALANGVAA